MIAWVGAALACKDAAAAIEEQEPPELPRIALQRRLAGAAAPGTPGRSEETRIQHAAPAASEPRQTVGASAGIHEEHEGQGHFVPHGRSLPGRAVPDDHHLGLDPSDVRMDVAQLHELLAAKDSAEVADEEKHRDPRLEEGPEVSPLAIGVLQLDRYKITGFHGSPPHAHDGMRALQPIPARVPACVIRTPGV